MNGRSGSVARPGLYPRCLVTVVLVLLVVASAADAGLFSFLKPKKKVEPLEEKVIGQVYAFRDYARTQPEAAFTEFAGDRAQALFGPLGHTLCPTTDPSAGWAYFFETAVFSLSFINPTTAVALFYHPWSDVALITAWTCSDKEIRITDTELLMGDTLRHQGNPPYDIDPLWLRGSLAPHLAAALASARTVSEFQRVFARGNTAWENGWRPALAHPELLDFSHKGAGFMFERNLAALLQFIRDPNLASPRDQAADTLNKLLLGQTEQVLQVASETPPESRVALAAYAIEWSQAKVITFVVRREAQLTHAFVLYSLPSLPEVLMSLWFRAEGPDPATATLKRIDLVDQNKAFTNLDEITKLLPNADSKGEVQR